MTTPANQMPLFEGAPVKVLEMAITGRSNISTATLHIGDEITVLICGTVTKIAHTESDVGLIRTHTVKIDEAHHLDDDSANMLMELRDRDRQLLDDTLGRRSLWEGAELDPDTGEIG